MKLYRSINDKELNKLLREVKVRGMYDCQFESQNDSKLNNVICTFTEDFRWKDKNHIFYITLDIPDDRILEINKGKYYVPQETVKSKMWTGRNGTALFEIDEAYLDEYNIADVVSIKGISHYANWYIEKNIKPVAEKYGIILES